MLYAWALACIQRADDSRAWLHRCLRGLSQPPATTVSSASGASLDPLCIYIYMHVYIPQTTNTARLAVAVGPRHSVSLFEPFPVPFAADIGAAPSGGQRLPGQAGAQRSSQCRAHDRYPSPLDLPSLGLSLSLCLSLCPMIRIRSWWPGAPFVVLGGPDAAQKLMEAPHKERQGRLHGEV